MNAREELLGTGSLLSLYGSWKWSLGQQAWQQVLLLTDPSAQPSWFFLRQSHCVGLADMKLAMKPTFASSHPLQVYSTTAGGEKLFRESLQILQK